MRHDLVIRSAELQDSQALADLCTQLGYPSTEQEVRDRLEQMADFPHHALFAAEVSGRVIGYVHVHAYPLPETDFHAEIGGLVVDEKHRGQGIGRRLLLEAETWARAQGCQVLLVRSNVIRENAHHFYKELGYQTIKSQLIFRKVL